MSWLDFNITRPPECTEIMLCVAEEGVSMDNQNYTLCSGYWEQDILYINSFDLGPTTGSFGKYAIVKSFEINERNWEEFKIHWYLMPDPPSDGTFDYVDIK